MTWASAPASGLAANGRGSRAPTVAQENGHPVTSAPAPGWSPANLPDRPAAAEEAFCGSPIAGHTATFRKQRPGTASTLVPATRPCPGTHGFPEASFVRSRADVAILARRTPSWGDGGSVRTVRRTLRDFHRKPGSGHALVRSLGHLPRTTPRSRGSDSAHEEFAGNPPDATNLRSRRFQSRSAERTWGSFPRSGCWRITRRNGDASTLIFSTEWSARCDRCSS